MYMKSISTNKSDMAFHKDKLMGDLQLVVADAEELLRATANQVGEGAVVARARIEENLRNVKSRMDEAQSAMIERTKQAAKDADKYVQENPWQSVGISAVVGIAIGILIARR